MSACFFNLFIRSSHKPSRPIKTAGKLKKKKLGTLLKIVLHYILACSKKVGLKRNANDLFYQLKNKE